MTNSTDDMDGAAGELSGMEAPTVGSYGSPHHHGGLAPQYICQENVCVAYAEADHGPWGCGRYALFDPDGDGHCSMDELARSRMPHTA